MTENLCRLVLTVSAIPPVGLHRQGARRGAPRPG